MILKEKKIFRKMVIVADLVSLIVYVTWLRQFTISLADYL